MIWEWCYKHDDLLVSVFITIASLVAIVAFGIVLLRSLTPAEQLPPNQRIAVYQAADGTRCYALMDRDIPLGFSCK